MPSSRGSFQPRDPTESPTLPADSLLSEPPGQPRCHICPLRKDRVRQVPLLSVQPQGWGAQGAALCDREGWPPSMDYSRDSAGCTFCKWAARPLPITVAPKSLRPVVKLRLPVNPRMRTCELRI